MNYERILIVGGADQVFNFLEFYATNLTRIKLDPADAELASKQIAALTADQRGDQLQRLERSMLRLERINLQTLAVLQKLVNSISRPSDESGK